MSNDIPQNTLVKLEISKFLNMLPTELRYNIYHYALLRSSLHHVFIRRTAKYAKYHPEIAQMMLACRTIHDDLEQLVNSQNHLIKSQIFGVIDPYAKTFHLKWHWSDRDIRILRYMQIPCKPTMELVCGPYHSAHAIRQYEVVQTNLQEVDENYDPYLLQTRLLCHKNWPRELMRPCLPILT